MPKVMFILDIDKDIENIYDKVTRGPAFETNQNIDPNLKKICEGKSLGECQLLLKDYLKKIYDLNYLKVFKESVQKLWDFINKEFFSRMNKIMKKEYNKDIKGYITTIPICPYDPDEPSFMVSSLYSLQSAMANCGHEIMHLYFHDFYWEKVEEKIGKGRTGDLKEALTVLLNLEFRDLWLFNDNGYEKHKELRRFIFESWKKEKDFDELLKKCIDYLT